jgi:hypothetical protein
MTIPIGNAPVYIAGIRLTPEPGAPTAKKYGKIPSVLPAANGARILTGTGDWTMQWKY